jgi:hypothetical protein
MHCSGCCHDPPVVTCGVLREALRDPVDGAGVVVAGVEARVAPLPLPEPVEAAAAAAEELTVGLVALVSEACWATTPTKPASPVVAMAAEMRVALRTRRKPWHRVIAGSS